MFIVRFNCIKYKFVENADLKFFAIEGIQKIVDSSATSICRSPTPIGALEVLNRSGNIILLQEIIQSEILMGGLDKPYTYYVDLILQAIVALTLDMQQFTQAVPNEYRPDIVSITPQGYGVLFIEPREQPTPGPSYF